MNKYQFKATNLIAETFESRGVKFNVTNHNNSEQIAAGFSVDCGPNVLMRFISRDDDNDVAARVFGLISNIPGEKRPRILEACNVLNHKMRFVKFYIDPDGDLNVEYDFPVHTPDDGVGEMAFEMLVRMMDILDSEYKIFMKALYSDQELSPISAERSRTAQLAQMLEKLRQMEAEDFETTPDMFDFDDDDDDDDSDDGFDDDETE